MMGASSGQAVSGIGNSLMGLSQMGAAAGVATQGANLQAAADLQGAQFESTLALQGSQYSADVYRSYIPTVQEQTAFSQGVISSQFANQEQALSNTITQTMSRNQATAGAMGIGLGSKSYLAVANKNLSDAEGMFLNMRNNEIANQNEVAFQGNLGETQLENQARGAEYSGKVQSAQAIYQGNVNATLARYQGQVAAYQAQSGASSSIGNSIGNGLSLLGGA